MIGPKKKKKKVQGSLEGKIIIITAIGIYKLLCVFLCKTAKKIWDILEVTHEGTT